MLYVILVLCIGTFYFGYNMWAFVHEHECPECESCANCEKGEDLDDLEVAPDIDLDSSMPNHHPSHPPKTKKKSRNPFYFSLYLNKKELEHVDAYCETHNVTKRQWLKGAIEGAMVRDKEQYPENY